MSKFSAFGVEAARFCERIGIERPVLNAPMSGIVDPAFVAAVCEAGGLGVVPAADLAPEEIRRFAAEVRALTSRPFAVNLRPLQDWPLDTAKALELFDALSPLLESLELPASPDAYDWSGAGVFPDFAAQFDAVLDVAPAAVTASFGGFREPEADRLRAAGIFSVGTATTLREAKVLRSAEVDALIVQGSEAAGARMSFEDPDDVMMGLSALLPAAVRATGLPVLAAGGVAEPRQGAALAMAGAAGCVLGTALLPTREARTTDAHKWFAAHGSAVDTVTTRLFSGRLSRVLRSALWEALADRESSSAPWPQPLVFMRALEARARELGRDDLLSLPLGQSAGRSAWNTVGEAVRAIGSGFLPESE